MQQPGGLACGETLGSDKAHALWTIPHSKCRIFGKTGRPSYQRRGNFLISVMALCSIAM